jgi:hypothetical protein
MPFPIAMWFYCNLESRTHAKAYLHRLTAYEDTEGVVEALADAEARLGRALDPANIKTKKNVKVEDEYSKKLKTEFLDELKDVGCGIL